jgi:hypothetical protein
VGVEPKYQPGVGVAEPMLHGSGVDSVGHPLGVEEVEVGSQLIEEWAGRDPGSEPGGGLWLVDLQAAVDVDDGSGDGDRGLLEVQVTDSKCCGFAEAETMTPPR